MAFKVPICRKCDQPHYNLVPCEGAAERMAEIAANRERKRKLKLEQETPLWHSFADRAVKPLSHSDPYSYGPPTN